MKNKDVIENASSILEGFLKNQSGYTYSKKVDLAGNDAANRLETTHFVIQDVISLRKIDVFITLKSVLEELFTVNIQTDRRSCIYYHFPFCFAEQGDFIMEECFINAFKALLKQINIEL